jgi:hypothetical protein
VVLEVDVDVEFDASGLAVTGSAVEVLVCGVTSFAATLGSAKMAELPAGNVNVTWMNKREDSQGVIDLCM